MRDELLHNFADAAQALINEGVETLSPEAAKRMNDALRAGDCLPELIYSLALPVIVFRFVRPSSGETIEIFRIENPPSSRN